VGDRQKIPLIAELLKDRTGQRTLIFCSSKLAVNELYKKLKSRSLNVERISSDLEQNEREQVMLAYRNQKIDILVATDVLSRGIDIDGIDLVINFEAPRDAEDYVHRIGRTARAERKGTALTLINHMDLPRLKRIEKLIGREVPKLPLPPGLAEEPESRQPQRQGSGGRSQPPRRSGGEGQLKEGGQKTPFRGGQRRSGGNNGGNKGGGGGQAPAA
jgi:superfamily II DNA/RNA helicase